MPPSSTPVDIREYLAAERTLLAYVRTGLALMGFGFVVARFGLFLQQIRLVQANAAIHSTGTSVLIGTALVFLGVVLNVLATRQYSWQIQRLNQIAPPPGYPISWVAVGLALLLSAIGIAIAVYLLAVRSVS